MNYLAWTDKSLKSETEVNQGADEQKLLWQILLKGKWFFDSFFLKVNESKEGVNVSLSGWIPIGRIPKNKRSREIVMKVDPWAFIDALHTPSAVQKSKQW